MSVLIMRLDVELNSEYNQLLKSKTMCTIAGDSGYAKEEFMLTPILPAPPENTREQIYNKKITKVRNCIERTNGVLKSLFRCLRKDRVLHYQPEAASFIINSCCVIYNMMHHYR